MALEVREVQEKVKEGFRLSFMANFKVNEGVSMTISGDQVKQKVQLRVWSGVIRIRLRRIMGMTKKVREFEEKVK